MLIPSIDLMGGKIVQLVQGQKKALEFENFSEWVERFSRYPLVQLVDLDAAKGEGSNRKLVAEFCGKLPCQVGGGIRSADDAQAVLDCGAKKVIIGSSLIKTLKPAGKDSAEDSEDAVMWHLPGVCASDSALIGWCLQWTRVADGLPFTAGRRSRELNRQP